MLNPYSKILSAIFFTNCGSFAYYCFAKPPHPAILFAIVLGSDESKTLFLTLSKSAMQRHNLLIASLHNYSYFEILQNIADIRRSVMKIPKRVLPFKISLKSLANHLELAINLFTKYLSLSSASKVPVLIAIS